MSQHYLKSTYNGEPVTVLLGWDRPLSQFFLVVRSEGVGNEEEGIIYSNLNELLPRSLGLDYFRCKLSELGIPVPEAMFEQVLLDNAQNTGNRYVIYTQTGSMSESII